MRPSPATTPARRLAWALYDWATSPFFAVVGTFVFPAYFAQAVASDPATGQALWGYALTASGLAVALLAPVLGAIADAGGRRKPWVLVFTLAGGVACAGLWTVEPEAASVAAALLLFAVASACLELAGVFYNAMLPDLAPPGRIGRLSGLAWGLGYAGGVACLVLVLFVFVQAEPPPFGLDPERAEPVRAAAPLAALWLGLFALPLFLLVPDRPAHGVAAGEAVRRGLATLKRTLTRLGRYRHVALFLLAHMLYADGLATLFAFGGVYAAGTFGMTLPEVVMFGITLNVTAGLGALLFAGLDDRLGPKRTILLALTGLTAFGLAALLVTDKATFQVVGACLGLFVGPAQAASRSLMARLAPETMRAEMFGLYALSGKATAFMGPFLLGTATLIAGDQRAGMATILVFFVAGGVLLLRVREPAAAGSGERASSP